MSTLETSKRKISVQVWEPLLTKLNEITLSACLNRDAYLDQLFAHEAKMLIAESVGKKNSPEARSFIKKQFAELRDLRPVSLNFNSATVDKIQEACDQVNTWRDVFINRVFFLLVANPTAINRELELSVEAYHKEIWEEGIDVKALAFGMRLGALRDFIREDQFAGMRVALRTAHPHAREALHMQTFGTPGAAEPSRRGLAGLNVYLEDSQIPGTRSYVDSQQLANELLGELSFEQGVGS